METDMATIVLKGVPIELRKRLEERARRNGRSVSGEAIACLEGAVHEPEPPRSGDEEQALLRRIRANRESIAASGMQPITDEEITAWKRQGRP
jgi:plasmid stability protein